MLCVKTQVTAQRYDTLTAHFRGGGHFIEAQGEVRAALVIQVVGGVVGVAHSGRPARRPEIRVSIPSRRRGSQGPSRRPSSRGDAIDDAIAKAHAKLGQIRVVGGKAVPIAQALNRAELVDQAHWIASGPRHNLAQAERARWWLHRLGESR